MYNSIADFIRRDVKEIEGIVANMLNGSMDAADLALGIQERLEKLGRSMQAEIYEILDEEIFKSIVRKKKWYVEHKNEPRETVFSGTWRFIDICRIDSTDCSAEHMER